MESNLPKEILQLRDILIEYPIDVIKTSPDGRINSILNESSVIEKLQEYIPKDILYIPPPRHWFDFCILDKDNDEKYYPVDIKITTTLTADNASGMPSLIYALTNVNMQYDSYYDSSNTIKYFNKNYITENNRDYYLVINNVHSEDVIVSSIKNLQHITPNKSNLPFQIIWKKNRELSHMNSKETYSLIKSLYKENKPKKDYWKTIFMNVCHEESDSE